MYHYPPYVSNELHYLAQRMAEGTAEDNIEILLAILKRKEVQNIQNRMMIADLLLEGKTINQICDETGTSSATICRVNEVIHHGQGYHLLFGIGNK